MTDVAKLFRTLPASVATGPNVTVPIGGGRGLCASLFSPDVLDLKAETFSAELARDEHSTHYAADVGSSPFAPAAIRFAMKGLIVDCYDIEPAHPELLEISNDLGRRIRYNQRDLAAGQPFVLSHKYSLVYANRVLSHLRFTTCQSLLTSLVKNSAPLARFYLSFSSLDSDFGINYPDKEKPIQDRFSISTNDRTTENDLQHPLCLYGERDIEVLIRELPLLVVESFTSKTGAIQVICEVVE